MALVLMNVVKHICSMERLYWNWQGIVTCNLRSELFLIDRISFI